MTLEHVGSPLSADDDWDPHVRFEVTWEGPVVTIEQISHMADCFHGGGEG